MQIEINGVLIEINKTWYNKSQVQEDGITHIIDTEHQYPVYQFGMAKNYFDIDDRNELLQSLVQDMRSVADQLEKQINKDKQIEDREGGR